MKTCIWCLKTEEETSFKKKAHTIPQSLGGKEICENVCDNCNLYFGSYQHGLPPIETVFKETFNIPRMRFLGAEQIGRNKTMPRFSSIYFNVNHKTSTITIKSAFKLRPHFQATICRQLKRGIYKVFLEELERQKGIGLEERFNFIREYARYGLGELPVLCFDREFGAFLLTKDWIKSPTLFLAENSPFHYLVDEAGFFEFELLGHVFGISTTRNWEVFFDNYIRRSKASKARFFKGWRMVENFNDVDLTLSILDDHVRPSPNPF